MAVRVIVLVVVFSEILLVKSVVANSYSQDTTQDIEGSVEFASGNSGQPFVRPPPISFMYDSERHYRPGNTYPGKFDEQTSPEFRSVSETTSMEVELEMELEMVTEEKKPVAEDPKPRNVFVYNPQPVYVTVPRRRVPGKQRPLVLKQFPVVFNLCPESTNNSPRLLVPTQFDESPPATVPPIFPRNI